MGACYGMRDNPPSSKPSPQPFGQRSGRGGPASHSRTAVATESPGTELLIVNTTYATWTIQHGTEVLAELTEREEVVVHTTRSGKLHALPRGGTESLTTVLGKATWGTELESDMDEPETFSIRALMRRPRSADAMAGSSSIEALNLMASTENDLKRMGVITLQDALHTTADDILLVPRYPLRCLFDLMEQLHGLRVL